MSNLSIMILCGRSPRHLYVANRLCKVSRPLAIVQETGTKWTFKKVLKLLRPDNLWRKIWRWLRDRKRYTGGGESRFFFGDTSPVLDRKDLVVEVPHINHPDVVKLADKLKPDVIAVFGTSLIRGPLLEKGKYGVVNLHGGLSPEYRGADCTFWALYNGEPEKVGCTLHFIDSGIDTGKLIAHVCPEIRNDNDELTLFWRAVQVSTDAYAELLERLENGERFGQKQTAKGHLYQVKDRGWKHEKALENKFSEVLSNTNLEKRIKWFTCS